MEWIRLRRACQPAARCGAAQVRVPCPPAACNAATAANHLAFEADARTVRAQARTILADPALLPATGRAAYVTMLNDFITVANRLQPGPGYGTTAQDYTAWYTALRATNITVS